MNRVLVASALVAAMAAAPIVAFAGPDGREPAPRGAGRRGHERGGFGHRRHGGLKVLKALDLTDGQKALLADGRAQAEPVRADLRAKIEALIKRRLAANTDRVDQQTERLAAIEAEPAEWFDDEFHERFPLTRPTFSF